MSEISLSVLRRLLPSRFKLLDPAIEVLDRGFPIREGSSEVDFIASSRDREWIFIWAKTKLIAEDIVALLADYDWIEKNSALWTHLFPLAPRRSPCGFKFWFFCLAIDPQVQTALSYLRRLQIQIFQSNPISKGSELDLEIRPWPAAASTFHPLKVLSSPSREEALQCTGPRLHLSPEEVKDLIEAPLEFELEPEDEITEPFFDPSLLRFISPS
jgi:hypothetical protein